LVVAGATAVGASELSQQQEQLFRALKAQRLVSGETLLVRMSFICELTVGAKTWRVVDTVELTPGAGVPRANNQILLLDDRLKLVKAFDYATEQPHFCRGNRLFLRGKYGVGNEEPYGNTLEFSANGDVSVSNTTNEALPVPPTSERDTFQLK
jgi:hypothetical protein